MQNKTLQTLKIYWQHSTKYWISGTIMLLSVIGVSVINTVMPVFFKRFFDVLTRTAAKAEIVQSLIQVLIILLALDLAQWAFRRGLAFSATHFESRIMADLANTCFQYLHKHSFAFFNNNFVGSLVKRANRFTHSFEGIADKIIFNLLPLIVNLTVILTVLTWTNAYLSLILAGWIVTFIIINMFFVRYKLRYDILRSEADTRATGVLADTITNNANVKLFNGYKREVENFYKVNDNVRRLRKLTWDLANIFETVQGFLAVILEIGLFYVAILLWQKDLVTVGDFVLIQSYVLIVLMQIWDLGRIIQRGYEDLADSEEMTEILNTPHEITDLPDAKNLIVKHGEIVFDHVDFNYNETRKILSNFNLVVRPGEKIALIGPSGAGKTTVVKILLRMYELTAGKIKIDGQDIAKVTQESLWQNISMVPQDPILFHRSLQENIRYGRPKATNKAVIEAAKLAHCHEFISIFQEGYNTFVGERGIKLSGGERQRVAIARAILYNSPILVLDEATSSLDSESEKLIQDALANLMKDKTVIVIAHRLSTIMKMDRIVVVEKGKIAEEGTHDELVKRGGIYNKLWTLQAGGFIK